MAAFSLSAMLSTAKTSFSSTQMMLLSKLAPKTICLPARSRSAVSSTTTGGLPGPAQIARLPEVMASFTTASPPVISRMRMPGCFISACALSTVGSAGAVSRSGGPPALMMARLMSWI